MGKIKTINPVEGLYVKVKKSRYKKFKKWLREMQAKFGDDCNQYEWIVSQSDFYDAVEVKFNLPVLQQKFDLTIRDNFGF